MNLSSRSLSIGPRPSIVGLARGGNGGPRRVLVLAVLPEHQWTPNTGIRPGKCVPGGIRTPNLLIRSQKLYPVELQALLTEVIGER